MQRHFPAWAINLIFGGQVSASSPSFGEPSSAHRFGSERTGWALLPAAPSPKAPGRRKRYGCVFFVFSSFFLLFPGDGAG